MIIPFAQKVLFLDFEFCSVLPCIGLILLSSYGLQSVFDGMFIDITGFLLVSYLLDVLKEITIQSKFLEVLDEHT